LKNGQSPEPASLKAHWRRFANKPCCPIILSSCAGCGSSFILLDDLTALKTNAQIFTYPPIIFPLQPQLEIFMMLSLFPFGRYYLNSLIICTSVVIGTLLSNTLIAYGFSRIKWVGRDVVFVIVLATLMLPSQVTMIPVYIIFNKLGWIGSYLPLIVPSFFGNAYFIFLLRQFFRASLLSCLMQRIDGCSEVGILAHHPASRSPGTGL
jgi:multiple sugar transport system permease protein